MAAQSQKSTETNSDVIGNVVEAIATDSIGDAPLYQVESLCMRCQQNVIPPLYPSILLFICFSLLLFI